MAKPTGESGAGRGRARVRAAVVVEPIARFLLRMGVGPDAVTIVGTIGVAIGALAFFPRGELVLGVLIISVFALSDMLDGTMARLSGRQGAWGAFLDSTLDRMADAAIFGGLVLWYLGAGEEPALGALALFCLAGGAVVSYARARAEGLGLKAAGGIAERTERLVLVLVTTGVGALGVPFLQAGGLWVLALAIAVTILQRIVAVRSQTQNAGSDDR